MKAHSGAERPSRAAVCKHVGGVAALVFAETLPSPPPGCFSFLFIGRAQAAQSYRHARSPRTLTSALINRTHLSALSTANSTFTFAQAAAKKEAENSKMGEKKGKGFVETLVCLVLHLK